MRGVAAAAEMTAPEVMTGPAAGRAAAGPATTWPVRVGTARVGALGFCEKVIGAFCCLWGPAEGPRRMIEGADEATSFWSASPAVLPAAAVGAGEGVVDGGPAASAAATASAMKENALEPSLTHFSYSAPFCWIASMRSSSWSTACGQVGACVV